MKAVVLAAGEGTRLRPLTEDKPKGMVEVADEPLLTHCFDQLIELCANELVVRDRFSVFVIDTDLKIWLPRQSLIHNSGETVNRPIFNDDVCTHNIKLVAKGHYFFRSVTARAAAASERAAAGVSTYSTSGNRSRIFSIATGS